MSPEGPTFAIDYNSYPASSEMRRALPSGLCQVIMISNFPQQSDIKTILVPAGDISSNPNPNLKDNPKAKANANTKATNR